MNEHGQFDSARAALLFALHYSVQQYDRPTMAKMAGKPSGAGHGLVGMDGAGQSGMILRELRALGVEAPECEAILIARLAPRYLPCACGARCCAGNTPNNAWVDALEVLTDGAREPLAGCYTHYLSRKLLTLKYLGEKVNLVDVAERVNMERHAVADHHTKVSAWLKKIENRAWHEIDQRLVMCGIVAVADETTA